ncbi:hypothetical protein BIY26_22820 [Brenneria goodwinii]|uniref:Uncharacterized protein n=1 Tax=Brenneria goodwinii TaxID=1109412 RepID=A0AAE8EK25_9GAMM|nr:hypothetical protein [Brenneria goodwinii]ATA22829.1 hypothetical protein AWC36_01155 [Brenneria goodwinii]RLM15754.1 hypothetical protein BIY26_22820 [Brenneria goodwinii]
MRIESYVEDMQIVGNVLASVSSSALQFSSTQPSKQDVLACEGVSAGKRKSVPFSTSVPATPFLMNAAVEHIKSLTAKHVRLVHQISNYSAEQIRDFFGENSYQDVKNLDLSIRGLEGYIAMLVRVTSGTSANRALKRLDNVITEYRLAVSDLLMILDQSFIESIVVPSQTEFVDESLFENFSFH